MKFRVPAIPSISTCDKSSKPLSAFLIIILALAAAVRFIYLAELQGNPLPFVINDWKAYDQYRFMELAKEFVRGNWLGSEVTRYSPAYSYLTAVLYKLFPQSVNTMFVFQILLGLTATYVIYRATALLFNNVKIGLLAALITAIYSPFIYYECCFLRGSVIAYSNLLGFYLLLKALKESNRIHFFTAGILLGISMVMRPGILPLLIIPYLLVTVKKPYRQRTVPVLLFIAGLMVIISPLSIRNRILGRNVLISYQGPASFWVGNTYNSSGITFPPRSLRDHKLVLEAEGSVTRTLKIFLREIKKYPREYRTLYLRKVKMFLNGYEIPANLNYYVFRSNHNILRLCFFNFSIVSPLAILGMILAWRKYRAGSLLYTFLLVLSVSVVVFHIQGRYRLPAVPFFIIFSSYAIYWLACMIKEKRFPALCCASIAVVLLASYTRPDSETIKKYFGARVPSYDLDSLGFAYLEKLRRDRASGERKLNVNLLRKAADSFEKAAAAAPSDKAKKRYLLLLGKIYFDLGRHDEAKEILAQVLSLDPDSHQAHFILGLIYEIKGQLEQAGNEYRAALKSEPDEVMVHYHLAVLYQKMGESGEAISEYTLFLSLNPSHPQAWNNLGVLYSQTDSLEAANECFRRALKQNPELVLAWKNLAKSYLAQMRDEDALEAYKEVLSRNPADIESLASVAYIYHLQGRHEEAVNFYEKLLSLQPGHVSALHNLGLLYIFEKKDLETGIPLLKKSVSLAPDNPDFLYSLGLVYYQQENFPEARQYLERAARLAPEDKEIQEYLQEVLKK